VTVAVAYSSVCIATDITGQVRGQGPGGGSRLSLPGRLWMARWGHALDWRLQFGGMGMAEGMGIATATTQAGSRVPAEFRWGR